jgi:hypothetical protein
MTFPTSKFSEYEIEQVTDTRISDERYFRNRARGNKACYYLITLTTPNIEYSEYIALCAKLESYENGLIIFQLPNPQVSLATFGEQSVSRNAATGTDEVSLLGQRSFKVGDFVQFNNHPKAYRFHDVDVRATTTVIKLSCPLVEAVPTSTKMIYGANVNFQVSLNSKFVQKTSVKNSKFGIVDVELIEQA